MCKVYTACPMCIKTEADAAAALEGQRRDAYGKVPMDKFIEIYQVTTAPRRSPSTSALAQEAEGSVDAHGVVTVIYRCRCNDCGYSSNSVHTHVLAEFANAGLPSQ